MTSLRRVAKRVLPPEAVVWLRRRIPSTSSGSLPPQKAELDSPGGPLVRYVTGLERKLWSTGEDEYLTKIARVVRTTSPDSSARCQASMALARWHLFNSRPEAGYEILEGLRPSNHALQQELSLCRVDCLFELGSAQQALTFLSPLVGRGTGDVDLLLRVAHARALLEQPRSHGSGPMAEALNAVYDNAGVAMIRRVSVVAPIGPSNIACDAKPSGVDQNSPRVTVITWMDDHAIESEIAIRSAFNQSWRNLQVIVLVPNWYLNEVHQLSLGDALVIGVERFDDARPWLAGVRHATGDFLTINPPGCWAHPQRVEIQAKAMVTDRGLQGNVTSHLRVGTQLTPRPLGLMARSSLVGPNLSSIMFRSSDLDADKIIAVWDRAVASLDALTGDLTVPPEVALVRSDVPLSITNVNGQSSAVGRKGPR